MLSNVIHLRVLGRNVKVTFTEIGDDHYGWLSPCGSEIKIQRGMSPAETLDTLIHETFHMIYTLLHVNVDQMEEENIVSLTASVFSAILIENVEFSKIIRFLSDSARTSSVPE